MGPLSLLMMVMGVMVMKDVGQVSSSQPSVSVGDATVMGTDVQVGNTTVNQYLGVRYAQPPVGPLRFSRPVAAPAMSGEVNATTYPSSCPGLVNILPMDEDCLFLSLYVPQSSQQGGDGNGLPVMVWIHGGAFQFGSGSSYDGSLLAAEGNVIVVTLNYRLAVLGFLSTGDNSSVGNYGLWDQWLALKWVRDNIGHFGGDVNRVTLFGESAGAASVSLHMTSPHSQGLFQRAILHSGSRFNPWALDREGPAHAQTVGIMTSCGNAANTSGLVTCLRSKPWQTMPKLPLAFPVVDGDFVLPKESWPLFNGPFIAGVNNREGGLLLQSIRLQFEDLNQRANYPDLLKNALRQLHPSLAAAASPGSESEAVNVVDCVYRGEGSTDSHVTDEELETVTGDVEIVLGSQEFLDMARATGDRYLYYFDHYPENIVDGEKGMDHAMDTEYTFGFATGSRGSPFFNRTISQGDQLLAQRFRSLLTNFARSGDPNLPAERPGWPEWPPYVFRGNQSYLSLTFSPRVAARLNEDLMTLWTETIPAVLESRGPLGLNETRWASCAEDATGHGPALSASGVFWVLGAASLIWGLL